MCRFIQSKHIKNTYNVESCAKNLQKTIQNVLGLCLDRYNQRIVSSLGATRHKLCFVLNLGYRCIIFVVYILFLPVNLSGAVCHISNI